MSTHARHVHRFACNVLYRNVSILCSQRFLLFDRYTLSWHAAMRPIFGKYGSSLSVLYFDSMDVHTLRYFTLKHKYQNKNISSRIFGTSLSLSFSLLFAFTSLVSFFSLLFFRSLLSFHLFLSFFSLLCFRFARILSLCVAFCTKCNCCMVAPTLDTILT